MAREKLRITGILVANKNKNMKCLVLILKNTHSTRRPKKQVCINWVTARWWRKVLRF